jgi:hypothetical protein
MIGPSEHDDLSVPPALATALREAAATVPPADHDLAVVRRRAQRHRRRRFAATSVAAAAVLVVGGLGVHRLTAEDADVVVPASVSGWERTSQDATLHVPTSTPEGWTLELLDTSPYPDEPDGPATSQLFAADGRPPLGRGVVVTSRAAEESDVIDGTYTVRGQPAGIEGPGVSARPGTLYVSWIEDGVFHEATALGVSEAELSGFLDSLVPNDDPTTGFTAPPGGALPELDAVTSRRPSVSSVWYRGPDDREISITAESPGAGTLISRLEGEPRGDGVIVRNLDDEDYPHIVLTRRDGWSVTAAVEAGSPNPALLERFIDDVEPTTTGQLVDSGAVGPATTVATVGDTTVEVHGTDAVDLAICLTPATSRPLCSGVVDLHEFGFTSASFVVDGEWVIVTITDGHEPGQVLDMSEATPDNIDSGVRPLDGERANSGGRVIEVVAIPDDVDELMAQSPMTDAGSQGFGYFRPE